MLRAIDMNVSEGSSSTELTCIEPYPRPELQGLRNLNLIKDFVQNVPGAIFGQLQSSDVLFIDSTHAVKVGSDVNHLYLDVLPKLPPSVHVHVHDVYLPYAYSRDVLDNYFGWQETALLLALLTNNRKLVVNACLSGLHYDRQDQLRQILTDYLPQANDQGLLAGGEQGKHFPSSLWLQTC
jgi:hypothetical protein